MKQPGSRPSCAPGTGPPADCRSTAWCKTDARSRSYLWTGVRAATPPVVEEVSAEEQGQSGGGAPGWVLLLSGHDADGACTSASLCAYPNCTFNQTQKNGVLNGPYASVLS